MDTGGTVVDTGVEGVAVCTDGAGVVADTGSGTGCGVDTAGGGVVVCTDGAGVGADTGLGTGCGDGSVSPRLLCSDGSDGRWASFSNVCLTASEGGSITVCSVSSGSERVSAGSRSDSLCGFPGRTRSGMDGCGGGESTGCSSPILGATASTTGSVSFDLDSPISEQSDADVLWSGSC